MIISLNPATDETLARFEPHGGAEIEQRLEQASQAQAGWARTPVAERMAVLRQVAAVLRARKHELGRTITLEMGKPLAEAVGEVEKCAWNFEFYADSAPGFLQDQVVASGATDSRIVFDPLGLVLAVMPWNSPLWQVMRAAAPVLAGGNGLVLKHASNVPQCALAIEQVFTEAGVPAGLCPTLLVGAAAVPALIADRRIAAVTFTGSTPAGRSIAAAAGQALKKQVLELGGSDPFIVLADADVATAATVGVKARFQNTGQSCIAAKRFIVEEKVADEFEQRFAAAVAALKVGNPMDRSNQ
ncbi:MAG: aldehyde dehydrogenase family protein, partial [Rubrivivax sp.]